MAQRQRNALAFMRPSQPDIAGHAPELMPIGARTAAPDRAFCVT